METKHRPDIDMIDVQSFTETQLDCKMIHVEELRAFEDRNFCIEIEHNKYVHPFTERNSSKVLVKVMKYSEKCVLKWHNLKEILPYLQQNGFITTQILCIKEHVSKIKENGDKFLVLLLNYISGKPLLDHWKEVNKDKVIKDTGEMVANLHNTLQKLEVSMLGTETDKEDPWKLDNAVIMLDYIDVIEDVEKRRIIETIIKTFCAKMKKTKEHLMKGITHGDLSDTNLIVNCVDGELKPMCNSMETANDMFGIIDFGDMCVSCYIFEVAQIIRDFMATTYPIDCYSVAVNFLSGYLKHRPLNEYELDILFITILTALCQYHVIGEFEFKRQPDNEYSRMFSQEASQLIMDYHSASDIFVSNLKTNLKERNINIMNQDDK